MAGESVGWVVEVAQRGRERDRSTIARTVEAIFGEM